MLIETFNSQKKVGFLKDTRIRARKPRLTIRFYFCAGPAVGEEVLEVAGRRRREELPGRGPAGLPTAGPRRRRRGVPVARALDEGPRRIVEPLSLL